MLAYTNEKAEMIKIVKGDNKILGSSINAAILTIKINSNIPSVKAIDEEIMEIIMPLL